MPLTPPGTYRKTRGIIRLDTRANQPDAADVLEGTLYFVSDEGVIERSNSVTWDDVTPPVGGDVVGPAAATDLAVIRFDGTTGKLIQNSTLLVADNGRVAVNSALSTNRLLTVGGSFTGDTATQGFSVNAALTGAANNDISAGMYDASFVEAGSGTHALIASVRVNAAPITSGAGATTNTAGIYVAGPMTGITPTGQHYSIWVDDGSVRFDGPVGIGASPVDGIFNNKFYVEHTTTGFLARFNNLTVGKAMFAIQSNTVTKGVFGLSGGIEGTSTEDFGLFAETGQGIRIYTNGSTTPKMFVNTGGDVGVGTTIIAFTDGTGLEIQRTGTATVRCESTGSTAAIEFRADTVGATIDARGLEVVRLLAGGAELFRVSTANGVQFGTRTAIGVETITGYITIKDSGGTTRKLAVVS